MRANPKPTGGKTHIRSAQARIPEGILGWEKSNAETNKAERSSADTEPRLWRNVRPVRLISPSRLLPVIVTGRWTATSESTARTTGLLPSQNRHGRSD
ncbi:uncharacterized protein FFB20_08385 [Fusarium fujikuroi]|nr:uncharacterized protein FFE2_03232 [Fusarium fujikuroi]SCN87561.1 uncharacterized protein FFM5_04035 [Fusarium fujikuroi]SCN88843.1 uncharacterized protein FFB20_08385 [Fusarium fujikuroi]SCO05865.1 uncharacterized protein FFC1_10106 [Fusarium fujikuroi]SCO36704.1 uncharacterized protein FFNC_05382 [Fusarium fujikuroi]